LRLEDAPCFLLSEALRGEGAVLRNARGERFMERAHPMKELAPRDVVARAIAAEMAAGGTECVYLDLSHRGAGYIQERFPRVYQTCLKYGIDLGREAAPIAPAAHYAMGGVRTDLQGRTSLARLFAAGEVACTGVHGANRLASNSLLEGLVFGARAGAAMRECAARASASAAPPKDELWPGGLSREQIRALASDLCGIVRNGDGLREAVASLQASAPPTSWAPEAAETRNMQQVAALIARAALAREESRGAHYRTDFPGSVTEYRKHSVLRGRDRVTFA
jgi:L-aspartate oxidase